jgi:hypothetical protein
VEKTAKSAMQNVINETSTAKPFTDFSFFIKKDSNPPITGTSMSNKATMLI